MSYPPTIGCAGNGQVAALSLTLLLLAACTSVSVDRDVGATEQLPAPDRVLVYNFAVTPQEVQLDAVGSAITSTLDGTADSQQKAPQTPPSGETPASSKPRGDESCNEAGNRR